MNLYLGNLNYRVKEGDLERALAVYGTVHSVKIIKDRETGKRILHPVQYPLMHQKQVITHL